MTLPSHLRTQYTMTDTAAAVVGVIAAIIARTIFLDLKSAKIECVNIVVTLDYAGTHGTVENAIYICAAFYLSAAVITLKRTVISW